MLLPVEGLTAWLRPLHEHFRVVAQENLPGPAVEGSEGKPGAETPLARLVRTIRAGNEPEGGVVDVALRVGEVRMVRRVERLRAKLKLQVF